MARADELGLSAVLCLTENRARTDTQHYVRSYNSWYMYWHFLLLAGLGILWYLLGHDNGLRRTFTHYPDFHSLLRIQMAR